MIRKIICSLWVIALISLFLTPINAFAHSSLTSYSNVNLHDQGARIDVKIPKQALRYLAPNQPRSRRADPLKEYVEKRLFLVTQGKACELTQDLHQRPASNKWIRFSWRVHCGASGPRELVVRLFENIGLNHVHFARVQFPDGTRDKAVMSENKTQWVLEGGDGHQMSIEGGLLSAIGNFGWLGIKHILSGWDHLAFVFGLVILAGTIQELTKLVTGFTLGHSITLALAVFGLVTPNAGSVEALIGFSIALIGIENVWLVSEKDRWISLGSMGVIGVLVLLSFFGLGSLSGWTLFGLLLFTACHFQVLEISQHPGPLRSLVALAFGLIHGLGFAGVLMHMELATGELLPALLGFNLGVEAGQLVVVLGIWPVFQVFSYFRSTTEKRMAYEFCSILVCTIGTYWFVLRTFG